MTNATPATMVLNMMNPLESVANFGIELAIEGNSQIFYNFGGFGLFVMNILIQTTRAFVFMDEVHFVELFNTEIVSHD
jgi:hypothetical protein